MGGPGFYHGGIGDLKRILSSPLFRLALGLFISGLSLYLALREVNLQDLQQAFLQPDLRFVGLALVSVAVNILVKVLRWRVLLGAEGGKAGFSKLSMSFLAAQMLNSFLPVRAGEISRIYVLGRTGIGHAFVLGTIAIEKILDAVAYALLFVLLLLLIPLPDWIGASGFTFTVAVFLLSLALFIAVFYRERVTVALARMVGWLPERFRAFVSNHLGGGLSSLDVLQSRVETFRLALETTLIWCTAVLTNQLVLLASAIDLPLTASLLLLIALQAGISIPSLPAKIGVFEFICVLALGVFGVSQAMALSYGILLHVIVYLPIVLSGLISFWILGTGGTEGQ